jgi:hypothetical protein
VLAGSEVGHGEVNKQQGSAIGLTRDRLVEEDRPGRSPASGGGGAAAEARTAVKKGAALNNVLHRKLPCGLGKMLCRSLDSEDRRRGELSNGGLAEATEAQAPVFVRLGLINKRLEEV